jgi:acyl-CoA synthetase (AMP-forming)/AMP-acid ligase II
MNIACLLAEVVRAQPDRPALIFHDSAPVTFRDLDSLSARLAGGFYERALRPADRVIVLAPISILLYASLIALFRLGATAVFLDPQAGLSMLNRSATLADAKAFIGTSKAMWLRWLSPALRRIPLRLLADGNRSDSLQWLADHARPRSEIVEVEPESPALITFTSGSTDRSGPRGVLRTHRLLTAQHHALARAFPYQSGDVDMPAFPVVTLHNLAAGITSVIPDFPFRRPDAVQPERILNQIKQCGITTASGSPAYWRPVAEFCIAGRLTLPLRRIAIGGAPVSPQLIQLLSQAAPQAEVVSAYGSTEAEPVAMMPGHEIIAETAALTAKGSGIPLGYPVRDIGVRILSHGREPKVECRDGEPGEIWVAGDHVARSYFANPQANEVNFLKQDQVWYRMGDVGYKDNQGRLWQVGRVHTTIHRAGCVVYPLPVEAVVETLAFVRRAALIGLPEASLGEKTVLAVEFKPDVAAPNNWQTQVRDVCAEHKWPLDEVRKVKHIPVDARHNARIDYAQLKKRLAR